MTSYIAKKRFANGEQVSFLPVPTRPKRAIILTKIQFYSFLERGFLHISRFLCDTSQAGLNSPLRDETLILIEKK
jgi:hypothetical protein